MKVIDQALLEKVIIERSRTSHKGNYGRLLLHLLYNKKEAQTSFCNLISKT